MKRSLRRLIHRLGFAVPLWLMGCGASQPVVKDATCSPNADAWYGAELLKVCIDESGKRLPVSECPEADAIGDDYEVRAEEECR